MSTDDRMELREIEQALDTIAEWLIALYGPRIATACLILEGYYSPLPEYYGIYPWITRADGETRETLPTREVQNLADRILRRLLPHARIKRLPSRDVREVARSAYIKWTDVPGHRRIDLMASFGRPAI